ncbi:MAG: hypothetical protein V1932_07725 [Chloroflexota bacterium]
MTAETKTKRNTDYSASAINLVNPPEVKDCLIELDRLQRQLVSLCDERDALIPSHLREAIAFYQKGIAEQTEGIRGFIDTFGSYQDTVNGVYAVKQRKVSKSYSAEPFEKCYPQFAPAVIIKAVNEKTLIGLIKGGLLEEARLEADGILKCTESFAYIIKG